MTEGTPGLWKICSGEIWDYEKEVYRVRLDSGEERWVWPNAGRLIDLEGSGTYIDVQEVVQYRLRTEHEMVTMPWSRAR